MRTLVLTAAVATALGAFAVAPANAGSGIKITGPWSGNDCRTVERTVYRDGMRRTVREKQCGSDRSSSRYDRDRSEERRYSDRRYDRDYDRRDSRDYDRRDSRDSGGVNLNIGR